MNAESPRIYVACLAAYNNGQLHGEWIDANQSAEDIMSAVQSMLAKSPQPGAEEWAIHDHDGFMGISIGEHESFDKIAELAELIAEKGQAWADYVGNVGAEYASKEGFEESYQGEYNSEEAFASQLSDDLGMMQDWPEEAKTYFNWESWTRDLFMGDYWMSSNGHVFRNS